MTYIDPRNKTLWHTDKLTQLRTTGATNAPVNVEIDLSNRCSLGCQWCHFAYTHTRGPLAGAQKPPGHMDGGDLMDTALAYHIIADLAGAGVKSITWTGGGEPTLHPDFNDIIEFAGKYPIQQGLYTHGGHITPDRAALLKRACTWVYVSLDEADNESYRRHKGANRFEAACAGIRLLVKEDGAATIGVGFLIHKGNWQNLADMYALGRALGVDYIQFRPTIEYAQDNPGAAPTDTAWMNQAIGALRNYEGYPFVSVDVPRFEAYRDWQGHGYNTCNWSALQTVITPNGKVWTCVNKRERADALLGDLNCESFAQVWDRVKPCAVSDTCRVMCRGHVANITLDAVLRRPEHENFI
jgi:MoaA/NifB/PqqE/SkfB family radical SAM enzyme